MKKRYLSILILIFLISPIYSMPNIQSNDFAENKIVDFLLSNYYYGNQNKTKEIYLFFETNTNKVLQEKTYIFSDVLISDAPLNVVNNEVLNHLNIKGELNEVYIYTPTEDNSNLTNECVVSFKKYITGLRDKEKSVLLTENTDKYVFIYNYLLPRTKESIIASFGNDRSEDRENCFNFLKDNKIITPINSLLQIKIETKEIKQNELEKNKFTIGFIPAFNTPIDSYVFNIKFIIPPTHINQKNSFSNQNTLNITDFSYTNENNNDIILPMEEISEITNLHENNKSRINTFEITTAAKKYLGTQYVFGGRNGVKVTGVNKLNSGIDCVGLLYVTLRDLGYLDSSIQCLELFRNGWTILDFIEKGKGQFNGKAGVIRTISELNYLRPGDLLFLKTKSGGLFGHAAIYVGKEGNCNKYIHASSIKKKVVEECLNEKISAGNKTSFSFPLYFARLENVNKNNINCKNNLVSQSGGKENVFSTDYRDTPPKRLTANIG